jgi:hypothetical protein
MLTRDRTCATMQQGCPMLDRMIAEFEAQQEKEQDKAAWRVQEQRILEDLAFPLWMQCREYIEAECKKHSKYLQFEVQPNMMAVVRSNRKVLSVEYFPNSYTIAYQIGSLTRRYSMRIDDNRQAAVWDHVHNVYKSPEEIADDLLSLIFTIHLEGRFENDRRY